MTLIQLRYLGAIVDAGLNISVAARQLHATQPGISKQVKQMEEELGFQLFVRRGKSLEGLTPAGERVLERARVIIAEAANIRTLAANYRREAQGELRIATTDTQARYVLPAPLAAVKASFPQVGLHLAPASEREALERIEQDGADIAIVSGVERPDTGDLVIPLYRWRLVGLAPAGHALAAGAPPSLVDLAEHPLVTYESALQPDSSFARAFAAAGLQPRLAFTSRDSDLIKTFVGSGTGVGLIAEMALGATDGGLEILDIEDLFPQRTAWAVLRRDRIVRDHVLEFLRAIAPHLERAVLRRAFDSSHEPPAWPTPPDWRSIRARQPSEGPPAIPTEALIAANSEAFAAA